jgi:hypothetical protein
VAFMLPPELAATAQPPRKASPLKRSMIRIVDALCRAFDAAGLVGLYDTAW